MKKLMKRSMAWLLVLAMCISFLPTMVFAAEVADETSFESAIQSDGASITLTGDVSISTFDSLDNGITINKNVTIDGNGKTISASTTGKYLLTIDSSATVTLKNVTLDATNVTNYAINAYASSVTLENVTIINASNTWYGVGVNGATVTATNLVVGDAKYAGVNVDPKSGASTFTLNSGSITDGIYVDDTGSTQSTATVNVTGGTVAGIAAAENVNAVANVTGGTVSTIQGIDNPTLPEGYIVRADGTVSNTFVVKAVIDGAEELLSEGTTSGNSVSLASFTGVTWENTAISNASYVVNAADDDDNDGVILLKGTYEVPEGQCIVKFYVGNDLYDWRFAAQGGTIAKAELPSAPTKEGHTFKGWKNTNTTYEGNVDVPDSEALNLNAVFEVNKHNVTTEVTPTDVPELNNTVSALTGDYEYGSKVDVEITTPEGYYFDSITVIGEKGTAYTVDTVTAGAEYQFTMPDENVTVTVNFQEIPKDSCIVNFIVDGVVVDSQLVKAGETVIAPAAPTVAGKTFENWTFGTTVVEAEGTFEVPEGTATLNVTAVLKDETYTITYAVDGGTPDTDPVTGVTVGTTITLPEAPTKDGSTFIGWKDGNTGFVYGAEATYVVSGNATLTAVWEIGEFIVRFLDTENNTIVDYKVVNYGDEITAPAGPSAYGKVFFGWDNDDDTTNGYYGASAAINVTGSVDYKTIWTDATRTIKTEGDNATFTGVPTEAVVVGEDVPFTVKANEGYALTSVVLSYTSNGILVKDELGTEGPYTFTMPDSDVTITATVKQNNFHIHTTTDKNVSIAVDDNKTTADAGTRVAFKVTPVADYVVQNVYVKTNTTDLRVPVTMEIIDGVNVYSFTMPEEDVTICADGVKGEYTVTYVDYDNTYLGSEVVKSGETATAEDIVTVREGYEFKHWTKIPGDGTEFQLDNTTVQNDLVLRAVYEGDTHKVEEGLVDNVHSLTTWVYEGSSVDFIATPGTDLATKTGDLVRFKVAAKYNYDITNVAVVSTVEGSNNVVEPLMQKKETAEVDGNLLTFYTYAFTMPNEDVKIDIYTEAKKYTVTVTEQPAESGDYTINGYTSTNLDVAQDETVTIPVTAIDGWYVKSYKATYVNDNGHTVTVKGIDDKDIDVSDNNTKTVNIEFKMVAKPVTVEVVYAATDYTVTCATAENGTITADPTTANVGDKVKITLTPEAGYRAVTDSVEVVTVDGEKVWVNVNYAGRKGDVYYYEFTMPASDVKVYAEFAQNIYEVEAETAYVGGTVYVGNTNTNVDQFAKDTEATVTVIPDAGYQIKLETADYEFMSGNPVEISVPYFQLKDADGNVVYDSWRAAVEAYAVANVTGYIAGTLYKPTVSVTETTNAKGQTVYAFTMPAYDLKVDVDFEKVEQQITVIAAYDKNPKAESKAAITISDISAENKDSVTVNGDTNGKFTSYVGNVIDIEVNPNKGYVYRTNSLTIKGESGRYYTPTYYAVKANGTVKAQFEMPAEPVEISAQFDYDAFTVTGDAIDSLGEVEVAPGTGKYTQDFDYKSEATARVTAKEGYYITDIDIVDAETDEPVRDAEGVEGNTEQTLIEKDIAFKMPNYDVDVIATYAPIDYTITIASTLDTDNEVMVATKVQNHSGGKDVYLTVDTEQDGIIGESHVGDKVEITATAEKGYILCDEAILITDENGKSLSNDVDLTYKSSADDKVVATFVMPAKNVKISISATVDSFTVTGKTTDNNGEVQVAPGTGKYTQDFDYKSEAKAEVIAKEGYYITDIKVVNTKTGEFEVPNVTGLLTGNTDQSIIKQTVTFPMPEYDVDVIATFAVKTYNIAYSVDGKEGTSGTYGKFDPAPTTGNYKDTYSFTVQPEDGYEIDTISATYKDAVTGENQQITFSSISIVKIDKDSNTVDTQYSFVMPDADVQISVTFKPLSYTDVVVIQGEGEATMNGVYTTRISAETGSNVNIVAIPEVGYQVKNVTAVTDAGKPVEIDKAADGTYSFVQPADEVTITVVFVKSEYTITYNEPANGTIENKTESANYQSEASFKVVPNDGYKVSSVTATYVDENGKEQTITFKSVKDGVYTFTMPAADVSVNVVYEAETYSVTTKVNGNGSVQLNGNYTALENVLMDSTVTINATPAEGYEISSVTAKTASGAGVTVTAADGAYTFKQPADDVVVTVTFVKQSVVITTASISYTGEHAKVTAPGSADYNTTVLVNVEPDDGFRAAGLNVRYTDAEGNIKYVPASIVKGDEYYNVQYAFTMPACKAGTKVEVTAVTVEWSASKYDDVRSDDWYYTAVNFVSNRGYFKGIDEGIFAPNMNMNRAMFVTVLGRIAGVNTDAYTSVQFSDVSINDWYGPYVAWAAENGIVLGYDADTFGPTNNITREQMAAIMYRYCEYAGLDTTIKNDVWMGRYTDAGQISSYAYDYMRWAVGVGLMKGMTDTTINPQDLATRAQVAQVIKNFCDKVLYQ